MVKFIYNSITLEHDWPKVVLAAWSKYPHPNNPNVLSVDVVDRKLDEKGRLTSTRFWACKGEPPGASWLFRNIPRLYNLERSVVDKKNKTFSLQTFNLSLFNLLNVAEICVYKPHPENPHHTIVEQQYKVDVKIPGFGHLMESWAVTTCLSNSQRGAEIISLMADRLSSEIDDIRTQAETQVQTLGEIIAETVDTFTNTVSPPIALEETDQLEQTKSSPTM